MTVLTTWLTETEAQHYIHRSARTLYRWRKLGIVRARKLPNRQWQYAQSTLVLARRNAAERYEARIVKPGTGRGHKTFRPSGQLELFVLGG